MQFSSRAACERSNVCKSIFFFFRHAPCITAFETMIEFGTESDKLISSQLNECKCQLYQTPAIGESEVSHIMPTAERTMRPWSLGCALPARSVNENGNVVCSHEQKTVWAQVMSMVSVQPSLLRLKVVCGHIDYDSICSDFAQAFRMTT